MKRVKSLIAGLTAAAVFAVSALAGFPFAQATGDDYLCYIDFGASYASGVAESGLWRYYQSGGDGKVTLTDERIEFSADTNANNSSGNRSVLLANQVTDKKIQSGGKYKIVFDLTVSPEMFKNLSAQFIFANSNWDEISGLQKVTDKLSAFSIEKQEKAGENTVYTLSRVITAPKLTANCNLLLSIYGGGNGSKYYLDNVYIYAAKEYSLTDENGKEIGKLYGVAGSQTATDIAGSEFDKIGYGFSVSPEQYPSDTDEKIVISYEPKENLVCYVDFGEDYAATDAAQYVPADDTYVAMADGKVQFKTGDGTAAFTDRAVLISNDKSTGTVLPGKKYRVTFRLISFGEITDHTLEIKFGSSLGGTISDQSALYDGTALNTCVKSQQILSDSSVSYLVDVDVTVPQTGLSGVQNLLISVFGSKPCSLDFAVVRKFFTYQAQDENNKTLGTITGFAGDKISDALIGSDFIKEDFKCEPAFEDAFPESASEKVILRYTEITNVLERIDFGDSYATKHRSGDLPAWQYIGGDTSLVTFGDQQVVYDGLINSGKSYGDRAVLLTNDRTTTGIKAGRRYQLQFDLLLKNETLASKYIDIRFGDQVWSASSYLVAKASDLTLLKTEYQDPYTVNTLAVTLTAPADKNILISIYGNGASSPSVLKNVTIYEEFAYRCVDENGDEVGTLYAFPSEDVTGLLKGSGVDKPGFFESVANSTAPAKQSEKITVHYEKDNSFVSFIDFGASYAPTNENRYYVASGSMTLDRGAEQIVVASNSKTVSDNFRNRSVVLANDYTASGLTEGKTYLITFDLTVNADFDISKYNVEFRSARYIGTGLSGSGLVYTGKELKEHTVEVKTSAAKKTYTIALGYDFPDSGWGTYTERNLLMSVFGGENACTIDNVEIGNATKVYLENTALAPLVGRVGYALSLPEDLLKKAHIFKGWYADSAMTMPFTQASFAGTDTHAFARFEAVDTETEMDFTAAPPASAGLNGFTHGILSGNISAGTGTSGIAYLKLYKGSKTVQISPASVYPVTFRYKTAGYTGKIKVGLCSATENSFDAAKNILATVTVDASDSWKSGGLCATPEILKAGDVKGDFLYFFIEYEKSAGGSIYIDDIVLKQETTVSFDTLGGNTVPGMSGEPGAEFSLPVPSKTGSSFTGWYYDRALSQKVSGDTICYPTAVKEMTLYASWDKADAAVTDEGFETYSDEEIEKNANDSEKQVFAVSHSRALDGNASMRYRFDPKTTNALTLQRSSFKLKGNSGASGQGIPVEGNTVYVLTFYVYAKALDTPVDFTAFTASGNSVLQNGVQVTASAENARISPKYFPKNEWKQVTYVFKSAHKVTAANELYLSVRPNSASVFTELYIDHVSVKPLASDMGAVAFNSSVYSATLVQMEYNYIVGKVGQSIAFPKASRENYVLENWYDTYRYIKVLDPAFTAGVKAAYPQWDISGTVKVSMENASDYPQDGSGTGINRYTNQGGGKVVIGEEASDGVAAYKYVGANNRNWEKAFALKETDGSPLRLVDGNSYIIMVDIFLESFTSEFGFNFCTASQDNYYAWNGSTTGSIIVSADTPRGVWITTALTINASFLQPGGFNLFLRHTAGSGNVSVYFDNFRISSIDPTNPTILINKGLIAGSVDIISGKAGEPYTLPETVNVPGYDFCGWYSSPALTRPVDPEGVFFETMTVYAKMLPKEFQNGFESGGYSFAETKGGDTDYELYNKNDAGHKAANVHGGNTSLHRIGNEYQHKNALIVRKNATLYPGEPYEISMWVKMDSYQHTKGAVKIASCSSNAFAWDLTGDMQPVIAIADLTDGKWHHVTYYFMASAYYLALQTPGYCSIYIDDITVKHLQVPGVSAEVSYEEYVPVKRNADGSIPAPEAEVSPEIIKDDSLQVYEEYQQLLDEYEAYPDYDEYEENSRTEKPGKQPAQQIRRVKKQKKTVTQKRNPLTFKDILTGNSYTWYTVAFYGGAGGLLAIGAGITVLIVLVKKKRKAKAAGGKQS